MIKRDSKGRYIKGSQKSKEMLEALSKRMTGNKNPAKQPGVGKKISEAKGALKGWVTKNPKYFSFMEKRREVKKRNNGGTHTLAEWETLKAQYNWTCPCCKKQEPEIKLTEDHIIPISKGGSDNIENIQPLCRKCNCEKFTKIIKYDFPFGNVGGYW